MSILHYLKRYLTLFFLSIKTYLLAQNNSLDHAIVSIYAIQTETGKVLIDQNSDISMVPASCMKVVTTAAALHLLGPEKRFETCLEYDGFIDDHQTLHGNLYIRGGGDPCLGSDRISSVLSWQQQIQLWSDAIEKLGIRKIEGKVIGDTSKWERSMAAPSWAWEDLGNYYGAGANALSFHENYYSLTFKPGNQVGEPATILRTDPPLSFLHFENEVKTGPEGSGDCACIYGSEFSPLQFIRGTIPFGVNEFTIKGAIPDPAAFCVDSLTQELHKRGITIENHNLSMDGKRIIFHTTLSPPVKEIVHWTNQKSLNLYAEHLLKKMGEEINGEGSTVAGIKAISAFLNSQKIDLNGFNMADGSGLSRKNLLTTKQLVSILAMMKSSTSFPIFLQSLPQQDDLMKAKSGSMSFIKGYVGYTGNIAFAILINQSVDHQKMNEKIKLFLSHLNRLSQN